MNEHERRAYGYLQKAVELRAMVADFKDAHTREVIERIAVGYEKLAKSEQTLARADEAKP